MVAGYQRCDVIAQRESVRDRAISRQVMELRMQQHRCADAADAVVFGWWHDPMVMRRMILRNKKKGPRWITRLGHDEDSYALVCVVIAPVAPAAAKPASTALTVLTMIASVR